MKRQHYLWLLGVVFASGLIVAACADESLVRPAEQEEFATPAQSDFSPFAALGGGQCMGDDAVDAGLVSGFGSDPNAFNCTANDISIANAQTATGDPIQCVTGQQVQVDLVADVVQNANSVRHDIGIWIAEDGGNAETGSCSFFYFDEDDVLNSGAVDADGDACGDMSEAGSVDDFALSALTLTCVDPVVQNGNTFLPVSSCVSWTQPGGDRTCPIPGEASPDGFRFGTLPANKSKCNCEPFLVEVEILAQLTLLKDVTNDHGGEAEDTDWTLQASSSDTTISGVEGDADITSSAIPAGTYALSESGGPSDYTEGSWSCTGDGTLTGSSIALASGESATCTITNDDDPATLTLTKKVVNDDGGTATDTDWTLQAASTDTTVSGVEGAAAITNSEVYAGVYTLSESGGPSDYTASSWSCTGDGSLAGDQLTLGLGESASCEITNDDAAAMLTLTKKVVNDHGGDALATAWTLQAASTDSTISGSHGDADITNTPVPAGTYALSESGGPSGYTASSWNCTGDGTLSGSDLTLAIGESASCEITNDDDPATLTLLKEVTNDHGGTAEDTDWTLQAASSDTTVSGVEGDAAITSSEVYAGTYALSESNGPSGYTAGTWSCTGTGTLTGSSLALGLGESATCTITNDDDPATLTLLKEVVNDHGGTAEDTDWTLQAASSDTTVSGVEGDAAITSSEVYAGTYALSESGGPSGYTAGTWSCTGTGTLTGSSLALGLGESATCTIINDDDLVQQQCESGDRLTSVSLKVNSASPDPLRIEVTDDNGKNTDVLMTVDPAGVGTTFTVTPESGTFFDSQNLRFALGPEGGPAEDARNLKVHLSCSDDPAVGDIHSGDVNGFSATLEKTGFVPTPFN